MQWCGRQRTVLPGSGCPTPEKYSTPFPRRIRTFISDVVAGGPGFVAVESESGGTFNAAVWTSTDGLAWTRVPHDDETFGGGPDGRHFSMKSVTVGGPGLVAVGIDEVGFNAVVWTSEDGYTWSRVPDDDQVFGDGPTGHRVQGMGNIIAGGPGLVAFGEEERTMGGPTRVAVWTSTDGTTWSHAPHDEDVFGFGESFRGDGKVLLESAIDVGSSLVAVGRHEVFARGGSSQWRDLDLA